MARNLIRNAFCLSSFSSNKTILKGFHNSPIEFRLIGDKRWKSGIQNAKRGHVAPCYVARDLEFKISKKGAIKSLISLLNISKFDAFEMTSNHVILCKTNSDLMKYNYEKYTEYKVKRETLIKFPHLLAESDIEPKLNLIRKLERDINTVVPLIPIPLKKLTDFVMSEFRLGKDQGRINILSTALQISEQEACHLISKKNFICVAQTDRLQTNVNLLTEFGITLPEICKDLWVLRYSTDKIQSRLEEAKGLKVEKLKTWMVRAQPGIFSNYIQRRSDNKSILGNNSLAEYLSERLECSLEVAKYIILKQKPLKNKSLKKLKEIIDFLLSAGFTPRHICRVPKILVHSVQTTHNRLKQLEEKGIQIDSVHMLTKSQKQFNEYYETLVKKNKGKNTN